ncbi:histidine protein methyltransferase 1 homolog [Toxorhynchites rutilus septentrionalis]|uniref:histidine protein methyltransferase 1 homolog n=1 Tax=Toxorhynchites rutilus septentrionalis TaxID=329112 RepID=UPI00247895AC|nr:histidine protein methyltransferase 1 homolog [Toxorhynchites rutilus septentrionalis]
MFKFSFDVDGAGGTPSAAEPQQQEPEQEQMSQNSQQGYECEKLELPENLRQGVVIERDNLHVFVASVDTLVEYINCLSLPVDYFSDDIQLAELDHSDLVPGMYEGGLKVWECTFDLGERMAEKAEYKKLFDKSTVLDLGCGSGILGIVAIKLGASKVAFQDYNKDVLERVTMKNYSLNCCAADDLQSSDQSDSAAVEFYSGDWGSFVDKVERQFDVILTSETIYNTKNYPKLLKLFREKLRPDGVVLLTSKTCYFGVGGGIRLFEKAMDEDGYFRYRTAWECDSGVLREILEIRVKSSSGGQQQQQQQLPGNVAARLLHRVWMLVKHTRYA